MNPLKQLIGFGVKFLVIYLLFFILSVSTGIGDAVRDGYMNTSEKLFKNIAGITEVKVVLHENKEKKTNILYQIFHKERLENIKRKIRETGKKDMEVKTLGFYTHSHNTVVMPLIFLLALILAYPSGFRRKIISIIAGITLMLVYIFFKLWCSLIYAIDGSRMYFPMYELSDFANKILEIVDGFFIESAYLIAVIIWILVCVRLKDFNFEKA